MQYRNLPKTDVKVSSIAFGCMSLCANPTYPEIPEDQAIATVHAALDAGINFIDNAPAYGDGVAEQRLGKALRGRRDQAVVATKISGPLSEPEVLAQCEQSLQRLQTDHIDLYQIHWPRHDVPISQTLGAMEKLVKAGKVRHVGVCNFGPVDLADAVATNKPILTNQICYSLLSRGAEFDVTALCARHGIGILCYSPLAQGLLTGRYKSADEVPAERARTRHFAKTRPQARHTEAGAEAETFAAIAAVQSIADRLHEEFSDVALAWLLHQPTVTAVLVGASRPEQIQRNTRAADLKLSPAVLKELDDASRAVKQKLGPSLDPWQSTSRTR